MIGTPLLFLYSLEHVLDSEMKGPGGVLGQDPQFSRGTGSWSTQGNSAVSAYSTGGSGGNAAVRLGQGGYVWQALWSGVRLYCLVFFFDECCRQI